MLKQIPESYEKQKRLLASHVAATTVGGQVAAFFPHCCTPPTPPPPMLKNRDICGEPPLGAPAIDIYFDNEKYR